MNSGAPSREVKGLADAQKFVPIYSGAPNINQYFNQTIEEIEYGIDAKLYVKKIKMVV